MRRLGLLVTEGNWVYTDYDWTWVSDEDWGWAADHYGRWYLDRPQGWFWIPGDEWAPAWVARRSDGGFVGWAPLPPDFDEFGEGVDPLIDPFAYSFVEERRFMEPSAYGNVVPLAPEPQPGERDAEAPAEEKGGSLIRPLGRSIRGSLQKTGRPRPLSLPPRWGLARLLLLKEGRYTETGP